MHEQILRMIEEERQFFDEREETALKKNGQLSTTALALSAGARFSLQRLEMRVRAELVGEKGEA